MHGAWRVFRMFSFYGSSHYGNEIINEFVDKS